MVDPSLNFLLQQVILGQIKYQVNAKNKLNRTGFVGNILLSQDVY